VCKLFILYILAVLTLLAEAILIPVKLNVTSNIYLLWTTKVKRLLDVFLRYQSLQVLSIKEETIWVTE